MVPCRFRGPSDLLRRCVLTEVVVEGHAAIDDRVLLPARRTLGERDLGLHDLLEQRVFRGLLLHDLVVDLKLLAQDGVRCLVELDVVLGLQLDVVLGIAVHRLPGHVLARRLHRVRDDGAHLLRQCVVLVLVEHDLELLGVLMVALQHADLRNVGKSKRAIGRGIVELGRVEQAAVHRRDDFAAGQRVDREAHAGEHVNRDADGAVLQALHVFGLGDRLLEPAERLGRHRAVGERYDVGADRVVELGEQLLAAAVLVPSEQHVGVHRPAGTRAPERERGLLAVVIDEHAVAAVEQTLGDGVEQLERRNDGAGRKHLDLEVAAGHVVDLLGVVDRELVEDVLGRPRALPAHVDRAGLSLHGRGGDGRSGGHAGAQDKAAAAGRFVGRIRLCTHKRIPPGVAPTRLEAPLNL